MILNLNKVAMLFSNCVEAS